MVPSDDARADGGDAIHLVSLPLTLDRSRYELVVEDDFDGTELDRSIWLPWYLPHWSSRDATHARYEMRDSSLRLRIDRDQAPWSPEFDGWTRVSSLQTAVSSGAVGSSVGALHFRNGLVVREAQPATSLCTPRYGLIEARLRTTADPANMAALWMIGTEDDPARSGEICIAEIFGRDVGDEVTRVGMGIHPFGDPSLHDDFAKVPIAMDAREPHVYSVEWEPGRATFFVDDRLVRVSDQSPDYPMLILLGIYEFADGAEPPSPAAAYPKELAVDWFRVHRPRS
jgi:Glycosyl hydrolases family 16